MRHSFGCYGLMLSYITQRGLGRDSANVLGMLGERITNQGILSQLQRSRFECGLANVFGMLGKCVADQGNLGQGLREKRR